MCALSTSVFIMLSLRCPDQSFAFHVVVVRLRSRRHPTFGRSSRISAQHASGSPAVARLIQSRRKESILSSF